MRLPVVALFFCGLTVVSCSKPAEPPKELIIKRKVAAAAGPQDSTVYWGTRYRVTDDAARRISFDLEEKTVTVLDKKGNAYFTLTFDEVLQQRKKQDERFLALPRDQRAKVGLDKPLELTASGKTETIAGHPAKEYTFGSAQFSGSVWMAEDVQPPPKWDEWNAVIANIESSGYAGRQLSEGIGRLKGYPVRSAVDIAVGAQRAKFTLEVTEVTLSKIPDEMTRLPAGAIKAESPIK
jgi:hypothetical protein